jgi:hypothetical protein
MSIQKYVWIDRDNQFVLRMDSTTQAGVTAPADMSLVTSLLMELRDSAGADGPSITVAKDEASAVINWWDGSLGTGEVLFKLGLSTETFSVSTVYKARITLFTAASTNGVVFTSYGDSKLTPLSLQFYETA